VEEKQSARDGAAEHSDGPRMHHLSLAAIFTFQRTVYEEGPS